MSTDLRELRVIPLVELQRDDAGAYVERERGRSRLGQLLERWLRVPRTVRVELDDYGAAAWRAMRNGAPVRQLGEALRNEFGDDAEPLGAAGRVPHDGRAGRSAAARTIIECFNRRQRYFLYSTPCLGEIR